MPKRTKLSDSEEKKFQKWYKEKAIKHGIDVNLDDPEHKYDYRGAYTAGAGPDPTGHWSSIFKDNDHPNRFINGLDTREAHPSGHWLPVFKIDDLDTRETQ